MRNLDPSTHKHADCIAIDQRKANDYANPCPYKVCGTFGLAKFKSKRGAYEGGVFRWMVASMPR